MDQKKLEYLSNKLHIYYNFGIINAQKQLRALKVTYFLLCTYPCFMFRKNVAICDQIVLFEVNLLIVGVYENIEK